MVPPLPFVLRFGCLRVQIRSVLGFKKLWAFFSKSEGFEYADISNVFTSEKKIINKMFPRLRQCSFGNKLNPFLPISVT